jgi:hypothetical protein
MGHSKFSASRHFWFYFEQAAHVICFSQDSDRAPSTLGSMHSSWCTLSTPARRVRQDRAGHRAHHTRTVRHRIPCPTTFFPTGLFRGCTTTTTHPRTKHQPRWPGGWRGRGRHRAAAGVQPELRRHAGRPHRSDCDGERSAGQRGRQGGV